MATRYATPIDFIEGFFDPISLDKSGIKKLTRLEDENKWVDFALHYLRTMETNFVKDFLDVKKGTKPPVRLYFEPRLREEWDAAATRLGHTPSPLIGVRPDPDIDAIDVNVAAELREPLENTARSHQSIAASFVTTKGIGSDKRLPMDKCVLEARIVSIADHVSARLASKWAAAIVERIRGSPTTPTGTGGSEFQSGTAHTAGQLIGARGLPLGAGLAR